MYSWSVGRTRLPPLALSVIPKEEEEGAVIPGYHRGPSRPLGGGDGMELPLSAWAGLWRERAEKGVGGLGTLKVKLSTVF